MSKPHEELQDENSLGAFNQALHRVHLVCLKFLFLKQLGGEGSKVGSINPNVGTSPNRGGALT